MIVQFIKYNLNEKYCEDIISRIKITKRNRDLLNVIKDDTFVEILGRTYLVLHTYLTIAVKNTGLHTDIFNVYVTDKCVELQNFYPTPYFPSDETIKKCKDYLIRNK